MSIAEKGIALVDFHNVVADLDTAVLSRLQKLDSFIECRPRNNFHIADDYPEYETVIKQLITSAGFIYNLPPISHALIGWQTILECDLHPVICSSPIHHNETNDLETLAWLEKVFVPHFGWYVVEQAIITSDKSQCEGVALIDDNPEPRHANLAGWTQIIFDRQYNQGFGGPRLNSWLDEKLCELLTAAKSVNM